MKKLSWIIIISLFLNAFGMTCGYADANISAAVIERMKAAALATSTSSVESSGLIPVNEEDVGFLDYSGIGTDITIPNDVASDIQIRNGASVTVDGNIYGNVSLYYNNSTVLVNGNVNSTDDYNHSSAFARSGTQIIDGVEIPVYNTIDANGNSKVYIYGDVINDSRVGYAINAESSDIFVDGDVIGRGEFVDGVYAGWGSNVTITGDIISNGTALYTTLGMIIDTPPAQTIEIDGNIQGKSINIFGGDVTIDGNVDASVMVRSNAILKIGKDIIDLDGKAIPKTVFVTGNPDFPVFLGIMGHIFNEGDIPVLESSYASTVFVYGGKLEVEGNINSSSDNALFTAEKGASTTVGGNVTSNVKIYKGATVSIGNNLEGAVDIAGEGSSLTVGGNIISADEIKPAISAHNGSKVDVRENVTSENTGIRVSLDNSSDQKSFVTVNGIVDGKNKAVELAVADGITTAEAIEMMPQIIVQTLESEKELVAVTCPNATPEEKQAIADALIANLFYIVNTDGVDRASIAIYGTEVVDGYVVAKENSTITLQSTKSGYVVCNVEAGKYATVTENRDGSYTITVERGGDLNISADVKKKQDNNGWVYPTSWDDYNWSWSNPDLGYQELWSWQRPEVHHTDFTPPAVWQLDLQNIGWDPAFALSPDYSKMELVINMIGRQDLCILRSDLEAFQRIGFETVNIVTEDSSLYMEMANLLELYADANQCMFVRNANTLELRVMNALVFTVTLVKHEEKNNILAS